MQFNTLVMNSLFKAVPDRANRSRKRTACPAPEEIDHLKPGRCGHFVNLHGHAALYEGRSYRGVPVEGDTSRRSNARSRAFHRRYRCSLQEASGKVSLDMAENLKASFFYSALYVSPVLSSSRIRFCASRLPCARWRSKIEGRYLRRKHQAVRPQPVSPPRRTSMPDFLAFSLNRLNRSI